MMSKIPNTVWTSKRFVHSYRKLDEDWQTKKALYSELASMIIHHVKGSKNALNVLDLGGGPGTLGTVTGRSTSKHLLKHWIVYDLAAEMMRAGAAFKDQRSSKLSFVQGNLLEPFAFENNTFDVIVCLNVLYQFADTWHCTHIAKEVLRVLKPGSILIAAGPLPQSVNSRIIRKEVMLRREQSNLIFALGSVALDMVTNLAFMADQRRLVQTANKKLPGQWGEMYCRATEGQLVLASVAISQSYAGQVGIWIMTKHSEES